MLRMKNPFKIAIFRYFTIATLISLGLGLGLLYLGGMNPLRLAEWNRVISLINKTKNLPANWIYGVVGWLVVTFTIFRYNRHIKRTPQGNFGQRVLWFFLAVGLSLVLGFYLLQFLGMDPTSKKAWDRLFARKTLPINYYNMIVIWLSMTVLLIIINPYRPTRKYGGQINSYGKSQWATPRDYHSFNPTVLAKDGIVLGYRDNRFLMSNLTLTTWVVAPPGTGKTAGVIIPSILSCKNDSLFINDPKGELFYFTAFARSQLGPVYRVEWAAGVETSACWNPLDLENLPRESHGRGNLIDRLTTILITPPNNHAAEESNSFITSAQTALSSLLLFYIYKAEGEGMVTSLSTVYHNIASLGAEVGNQELLDPVAYKLKELITIAETKKYPIRIVTDLNQFISLPQQIRWGIMATMMASLRIFLNENVAAVTSRNTIHLNDLRGNDGRPMTIYIVVPALEQQNYGKITGLFIEALVFFLTHRPPQEQDKIVRFILDEAGFLPSSKIIAFGPSITRSYKVSFLFAFQDYSQVSSNWGEAALENLKTNAAYTIILSQNNERTAEVISRKIGNTTQRKVVTSSTSTSIRHKDDFLFASGSARSTSSSVIEEEVPLIRPEEVMSLPLGEQILIVQNHGTRPIYCDSAYYARFELFRNLIQTGNEEGNKKSQKASTHQENKKNKVRNKLKV